MEIRRTLRIAVLRTRSKSAAKGLTFDLTLAWAMEQAERQQYRCCLTGGPFLHDDDVTSYMRPYAPSLDRIAPKGGYTRENVRIVIFAVNAMLSDWGPLVMERVANGYRYVRSKRRRDPLTLPESLPLTYSSTDK